MQIHGVTQIHGPHAINAPHSLKGPLATQPSRSTSGADELQLSEQAQLAARLSEIPDIRTDRVQAIREAISQGVYETNDKLDLALDRLLDEIG